MAFAVLGSSEGQVSFDANTLEPVNQTSSVTTALFFLNKQITIFMLFTGVSYARRHSLLRPNRGRNAAC